MSNAGKKTDNAFLASKLELRRHFLTRHHAGGGVRVLDCCQGDGTIWNILKREFDLESYWGVDVKPRPGRLRIDSLRLLAAGPPKENVIDVDTYGSPWKHYAQILLHINKPTTVFLTFGLVKICGGGGEPVLCYALGLTGKMTDLMPGALMNKLCDYAVDSMLFNAYNVDVVEVAESFPQRNARYIGVHLKPKAGE